MHAARALQFKKGSDRVDAARFADAPITGEYLVAKIAGIGAKLPLIDAEVRTERKPAQWDFQVAPSAERASVRPFLKTGPIGEAAGHGAGGRHGQNISIIECSG